MAVKWFGEVEVIPDSHEENPGEGAAEVIKELPGPASLIDHMTEAEKKETKKLFQWSGHGEIVLLSSLVPTDDTKNNVELTYEGDEENCWPLIPHDIINFIVAHLDEACKLSLAWSCKHLSRLCGVKPAFCIDAVNSAAFHGYVNIIDWMRRNHCHWNGNTSKEAARGGQLDILKALKELGTFSEINAIDGAACGGHVDILKWFNIKEKREMTNYVTLRAAEGGHVHLLSWLDSRGILSVSEAFRGAVNAGNTHVIDWLVTIPNGKAYFLKAGTKKNLISQASTYGRLEVIQHLVDVHGAMLIPSIVHDVANDGQLEILKWLKVRGVESPAGIEFALQSGNIEVIIWMHEQGYPWKPKHFSRAVGPDFISLHFLKWMRSAGCPWEEKTCEQAASWNRLEVLKWLREEGCPWCPKTTSFSVTNRNFEMFKWIMENGGKVDKSVMNQIDNCKNDDFKNYLQKK